MTGLFIGLTLGIPLGAFLFLVVLRDDGKWPVIVDRWWLENSGRWESVRRRELKLDEEDKGKK